MQAEQQLPKGWTLMRDGTPSCPDIPDWLIANLPEGSTVGIDPFLHTVGPLLSGPYIAQHNSGDTYRNKLNVVSRDASGSSNVLLDSVHQKLYAFIR